MRESRLYGFVRGARGNSRPYRYEYSMYFAADAHERVDSMPRIAPQKTSRPSRTHPFRSAIIRFIGSMPSFFQLSQRESRSALCGLP
jgi:hypothetical protein